MAAELRSQGIFSRAFPVPKIIAPVAAGVDISDASIKWLTLQEDERGFHVQNFGEEPLQSGVVVGGIIHDVTALAEVLKRVRGRLGEIHAAHAALPEESAYVFDMHVPPGTSRADALHLIEFEFEGRVPIPPGEAVFDFDTIRSHEQKGDDIGVAVFPKDLAKSYVAAFAQADFALLSLELEARSIARAIMSDRAKEPITLLVDFGRARTGFAVLKSGIPIFTSTVEIGGDQMTKGLMEKASMPEEDAVRFRNEEGVLGKSAGAQIILPVASALADEVTRHFHYWDTRRDEGGDRVTPVEKVMLAGGSANLKGLADYIASRVQAPTEVGNVWRHICDFDDYIPPIDHRHALQYATAIGLALRGKL